ncbi:MAG TPA: alpha-amylase family glycosyl hydrolase, partial [Pseudobdellovibrionaceae bacterium]|nr:alpha-amylase family glycosyl hydrolase [Pseudobdellovibrionaceae bacterium]
MIHFKYIVSIFYFFSIQFVWAGLPLQSEPPKTVFVQLFEWPWKEIARECEIYLGPKKFAAVQVSPPQEHLINSENTWWSRYQVVSYKLESRSGTEEEFIDMVQRCKNAGVDVYVDTVINHMTGVVSGVGSAGTQFTQYEYPGLYTREDFHFCGRNGNNDIHNWTDLFELHFCQLVGLADLKTESYKVQKTQVEYLNRLTDIGVKGFRIDAAKHMPPKDILSITSQLKNDP